MILAYGIVTVLAVIVGSVVGHILTKYFAKRRANHERKIKGTQRQRDFEGTG